MVLTVAQTTTFFEHADQMGIPHATVIPLCAKGIKVVADLADFDKESLQQLVDNLRCPGGYVPDPNPGAVPLSLLHPSYLVPNHKSILPSLATW